MYSTCSWRVWSLSWRTCWAILAAIPEAKGVQARNHCWLCLMDSCRQAGAQAAAAPPRVLVGEWGGLGI